MRLVSFSHGERSGVGVVTEGGIYDADRVAGLPSEMSALLAAGRPALEVLEAALARDPVRLPLEAVRLGPPVRCPRKFLAVGLNYADHIEETGRSRPAFPTFFNKQSSCVNGPYDPIHKPRVSEQLDYEGELGLVIGRRCRHVPRARAYEVIAGYLVVNDVSVRDWQARSPTMTLGKSFDTHGPIGPWIVTADELPDPQRLTLKTYVNGELRQSTSTRHMLWDCYELIEILSTVCTLWPGDILSTGTGKGVGMRMDPPRFLQIGDVVRVEIEGIGAIENPVIAEPGDTALW